MTATMRLFAIEWRRSIALWFFPLMALAGGWYAANMLMNLDVAIWPSTSAHIGLALVVIVPLMGGVAAWAAGRDRRRGIVDLLATTPHPVTRRDLTVWGSVALWGVLAYVAAGLYDVIVTMSNEPWGEPEAGPIVIGMLAIVTGSAIGYLVGALVPSRFVPPLVAIVLFFTIMLIDSGPSWDSPISNLSPLSLVEAGQYDEPNDVFYVDSPSMLLEASLWLIGLTGVALTLIALRRGRTRVAWSALAVSAAAAVTGAALLMSAFENDLMNPAPWEGRELAAYTPVCVERSIPICAHPAFEPLLAGYADLVDELIEPLLGLPGAPVRAEQLPYADGFYSDGTLAIDPTHRGIQLTAGIESPALALVQDSGVYSPGWSSHYEMRPEQYVIAFWLAQRVEERPFEGWYFFEGGRTQASVDAAVTRFNALSPVEQRTWLEANYADLRAGRLDMGDLP